jgi:hypothetical protein
VFHVFPQSLQTNAVKEPQFEAKIAFFHKIPVYLSFVISSLDSIKAKQLAAPLKKKTWMDFKIRRIIYNTQNYELLGETLCLTYEMESD